ncbi:MAG: prepilin-type N-terminal cleavage/methylation domain-containing protein [Candidatus Saccharimonadales bacterium]
MRLLETKNTSKGNKAFTVIELMVATSVFSILLLLSLAGFLQIGQLFHKGVNITRTSDTAKQVINSIKNDISYDAGTSTIAVQNSTIFVSGVGTVTRSYFCAGQNRYIYIRGSELDEDNKDVGSPSGWYRFGLLKEPYTSANCSNPNSVPINANTATELLGDKMRLSNLTIQPVLGSLYTLRVYIAYGDDEVLTSPANATNARCQSGSNFSRYCFVADFTTTARRGIQP